ncbi:MAG: thiamine-phosphate pyrophosphorylase [Candidatus Omnitrophica bacterium]|nr:thiamine-phosphate pyrophosphorylase [Candidatus Omnitrophota bacterium]
MDTGVYRIIDANLNRGMEGIRVCEDITRFTLDDQKLTEKLKNLRHEIFFAIKKLRNEHLKELVLSRDTDADVGKVTNKTEKIRESIVDLFLANSQRGKESLRVLEEVLKLFDSDLSQEFKNFRFKLYAIEKIAVKDIEKFTV